LISNALKFKENSRPLVVNISAKVNENGTTTFSVADNGSGFDQKYADKVFDIFQKLHGKHTHHGTGVGLAICKRILSVHGGEIAVESLSGVGTTVFITFPIEHKYERKL